MTDFTREELQLILADVQQCDMEYTRSPKQEKVMYKLQSMVDSYSRCNEKRIAQSHLEEAKSLISHALCLLGMDENE